MMKNLTTKFLKSTILMVALVLSIASCDKVDEGRNSIPSVSFETALISVNTETGEYTAVVNLSEPARKDIDIKFQFSGTAIENEHYTVDTKEVTVLEGQDKASVKINILNENIWDASLELKITLAPSADYVILPTTNTESVIMFTKDIVLPIVSLETEALPVSTNPYNQDTIAFTVKLDQQLTVERELNLSFEGGMVIGTDFTINEGNNNVITIPEGVSETTFSLEIKKKDEAGFKNDFKISIAPSDPKYLAVSQDESSYTLIVSDPLVDLTPILRVSALAGGAGFQIYQAIKATDDSWVGKVVINSSQNTEKKNYLKTHKNQIFISAFDCNSNLTGGDVLRLADMLKFDTSDTVIADYGASKTTRFFSTSDSLLRFVAEEGNTQKGKLSTANQKFKANLILRADWETGTNGNKQWHVDSKANGGDITKSTYPTFATMEVELVKVEGTYDFTLEDPEMIFDAWFKSSSPYFMRILPDGLKITKDGDMYKVSYKLYPR